MTMNEYQAKEDDIKADKNIAEPTEPTPESLRQAANDATQKILKLQQQREQLKKKADKLALEQANKFYAGKWVLKLYNEYYHIKTVDESLECYNGFDKRPYFRCTCDRSLAFTYFKGLRIYQEPVSEILTLDKKTKVLDSDEMKKIIAKFRTEITNALYDVETNFC
jgi:hypothetical protein